MPRVSNGMSPGGGSTPVVGSPPGRGFGLDRPPDRALARLPGATRLSADVLHGGTAERNGRQPVRHRPRTYSGQPVRHRRGGHTSNPTPRSHHTHASVAWPELQPHDAHPRRRHHRSEETSRRSRRGFNTVKVLRDMLKEVDVVTNPEALDDLTIDELSEQCRQMRPRVSRWCTASRTSR